MTRLANLPGNLKIALFCGGRGSATIIRELMRWPNVELTLLVNAYDDGLSTGALRNFIPGMLGPSDFRKNISYMLDLYSASQYALRTLIEMRLPEGFGDQAEAALVRYAVSGDPSNLPPEFLQAAAQLDTSKASRIRQFLRVFLDYARASSKPFDYRDCSVGNLVLAGAYLSCNNSFNVAARELSQLANSRAVLVNVSKGENRVLAGLKADGTLLSCEAEIVGRQSAVPIVETFFLPHRLTAEEWAPFAGRPLADKIAWLKSQEVATELSDECRTVLEMADIIIYGPGTQHSSLLPSYRIAQKALKSSPARVKAFVLNLAEDHDIQGLTADQLVDKALYYIDDPGNHSRVITHLMFSTPQELGDNHFAENKVGVDGTYLGAPVIEGLYRTNGGRAHNGYAIIRDIMQAWESAGDGKTRLDIFVDLYKRAPAIDALLEEFLEINWSEHFAGVNLRINSLLPKCGQLPPQLTLGAASYSGDFPEVSAVLDWLKNSNSEYLVTLTGDGEYRFRDVLTSVRVLRDSTFGVVYGSRTQSRRQFSSSLQAAYGDGSLLRAMSWLGAFLLSVLFTLRFGIIFSDPLTGFRIYRRRYAQRLGDMAGNRNVTPATLTRVLIANNVEIAELPVRYRTYVGFTDPRWRLGRGLKNLLGIW